MLRIHQLGFERRDAEERGVEQLDVVEHAARRRRRPDRRAGSAGMRRVELVRLRRRGSTRGPSHRLAQNASTSRGAGEPAGHADDRDRLVGRASGGTSAARLAAGRVDRLCQRRRGRRREERRRGDVGQAAVAQLGQQAQRQQRIAAELEEAVERADLVEAEHSANAAQMAASRSPDGARYGCASSGRALVGAGSAARSSLPLAVTGSAASETNDRRHHEVGQQRGELRAQHRRRGVRRVRRHDVGDQPLDPSGRRRRSTTAHELTPGSAASRASISPSSMRKPRILTCVSARPKNSRMPSGRQRTRSPVRYRRPAAERVHRRSARRRARAGRR